LAHLRQRSRLARSCTKVVGGCFMAAKSTSLGVLHRAQRIFNQILCRRWIRMGK
jgi:hypothetical protein